MGFQKSKPNPGPGPSRLPSVGPEPREKNASGGPRSFSSCADEFRPAIPRSGCSPALPPSRPRGLHPGPLTDPCLSLSTHTARATQRRLPPSVETSRLLLLPVGQVDPDAGDPPPSLHGHYSVSSVLRGSPPLTGSSVVSALRSCRLRLFPCHRQPGSQVPYESPDEVHAA
jgi:hypothetical protein